MQNKKSRKNRINIRDSFKEKPVIDRWSILRENPKMNIQEYTEYYENHMFFIFQTGNVQQINMAIKSLKNVSGDLLMPLNKQIEKIKHILKERQGKPNQLSVFHFKKVSQTLEYLNRASYNTLDQRLFFVNESLKNNEYEKSIQEIRFIKEHVENYEKEIFPSFIHDLHNKYQALFDAGKISINVFCAGINALHELTRTLAAVYDRKLKKYKSSKENDRNVEEIKKIRDEFNKKSIQLDSRLLEDECRCRDMNFYAENKLPYKDALNY